MTTTLVTALFDLKRGDLNNEFKRPIFCYFHHLEKLCKACKNIPMYIYLSQEHVETVKKFREGSVGTEFRVMSVDDFKTWFPFYDEVTKIRQDPTWLAQASWLSNSTQAKLDLYNPLVMSKMAMLNDASIFNPFKTENFFWIDAGLTQTVHEGYFSSEKVIERIESSISKFTFVCFPYKASTEIHGFDLNEINRMTGTNVDRVARGGFFGGNTTNLAEINSIYYYLLKNTLTRGFMGTEESLFTIMSYQRPDLFNVEMINEDGLMGTFFERAKNLPIQTMRGTSLYIVTFNSPPQLQLLFNSIIQSNPEILNVEKKYLIDNSTDQSTVDSYNKIATSYGFEIIRQGNMGICGARQWAAQHFQDGNTKYMLWFEDDMLLEPSPSVKCKSGLSMHCDNWLAKSIRIIENEKLDFLKLSFTEFFGDHHLQWAWFNLPQDVKIKYFPTGAHKMAWKETGMMDGLGYLLGDVYYSNWPSVMTRAGNYKIFLETKFAYPYEQTIMSHVFQEIKKGRIKSGVVMASLINHNRVHHYSLDIRKEC